MNNMVFKLMLITKN